MGDRSFYMCVCVLHTGRSLRTFNSAPKLLNDLTLIIRNMPSVNAFKKAIKTHLFQKAFPSQFIVFILFIKNKK